MKNGFTMIEFMIIVAILGILSTIAIPVLTGNNKAAFKPAQEKPSTLCIGGYMFLSDGKTQILNSTGGGVQCNSFK